MDRSFIESTEKMMKETKERGRKEYRNDLIFAWVVTILAASVVVPGLIILLLSAIARLPVP